MKDDFVTIYQEVEGHVMRHIAVDTNDTDYILLETISIEKAIEGHIVEMLPKIHVSETAIRDKIFPGVKFGKNPDLRMDGEYIEVKQPVAPTFEAINRNISKAVKQADYIIIDLHQHIIHETLDWIANRKFVLYASLNTIEFRHKGQYKAFTRK